MRYNGVHYSSPTSLLAAARTQHPQLPADKAWKVLHYCGVALRDLHQRGFKLYQKTKNDKRLLGRHLQPSTASDTDSDREP